MEFDSKITVVTGAASGIGAASARAFAAEGARVVCVDINQSGAEAVAAEINGMGYGCDVSSESNINDLVSRIKTEVGEIDLFFSNAGVATGGDPLTTPLDIWESQWHINVMAHIYAIRAILPDMLNRGEGYFVHTASMAGYLTTPRNLTYAVTKHAVVGLAEWMSITYHHKGIGVSLLAPLAVRTPMLGTSDDPATSSVTGPMKEPEEVAQQVIDAVRAERFLILTDEIAQTWMERKTNDPERWLNGMRRLQIRMDDAEGNKP
jgi:NAD(P)-dependent dehydrogenase (short-subunit alcohol dehydrogenase family)